MQWHVLKYRRACNCMEVHESSTGLFIDLNISPKGFGICIRIFTKFGARPGRGFTCSNLFTHNTRKL